MNKRVICVMGRILDQDDGLGVYALHLLWGLATQDPATRYVILLRTPKHARSFDAHDNVETRVLPARVKTWWDQVTVPLAARQIGASIIFNPKFSLPLFTGRPTVMVLHGSDWYVNPGNYEWWDNIYIRLLMPTYCRKATKLLSISRCVVDDLVRHAGIDRKKVSVTLAAPAPQFSPVARPERLREFARRYHLPEQFIFSVVRAYHTGHARAPVYPGGNADNLIRGYQMYREGGGRLPLLIAGTGIDRYLSMQGFQERDLEGVRFAGFIPNDEMALAYNLASLFVLVTLYESFSLPLVEALACGCPTIAPNTGACPEVAGDAVLFVDPRSISAIADAMEQLATDADVRERLRTAGLERVKRYSWENTTSATLKVFDSIVPRPPVR